VWSGGAWSPGVTVCQLTSVPTSPPLSISMSQLSPIIMSEIPDLIILIYNGCVPADPEWTGAMPRPIVYSTISTSPVTNLTSAISNIQLFILLCVVPHWCYYCQVTRSDCMPADYSVPTSPPLPMSPFQALCLHDSGLDTLL